MPYFLFPHIGSILLSRYRNSSINVSGFSQFYRDYNDKTLFLSVSVKEYKPYLLTEKYSIATHNDNFCPLKTFCYHIILVSSSVKEILETIKNLSHIYQTVDCLYTLYKHRFFISFLEESGVVFAQLTRAVEHNLAKKYVERVPSISKKRLSRKKFKRHLLRAEQRSASTQTLASSFLDRIYSLRNSKYESELIMIVDCLLDGHGIIDNPLLYLEIRK